MGISLTPDAAALVRVLECDRCILTGDPDPSLLIVTTGEERVSWISRGGEDLCWHCRRALARSAGVAVSDVDAIWASWGPQRDRLLEALAAAEPTWDPADEPTRDGDT